MVCEECGAENVEWAVYCALCGKPYSDTNERLETSSVPIEEINSLIPQLSEKKIKEILKESVLLKIGKEKNLEQGDIDNIFVD